MNKTQVENAGNSINFNLYIQAEDNTPLENWITAKPNQIAKKLKGISNKVKARDKRTLNAGNNAQATPNNFRFNYEPKKANNARTN